MFGARLYYTNNHLLNRVYCAYLIHVQHSPYARTHTHDHYLVRMANRVHYARAHCEHCLVPRARSSIIAYFTQWKNIENARLVKRRRRRRCSVDAIVCSALDENVYLLNGKMFSAEMFGVWVYLHEAIRSLTLAAFNSNRITTSSRAIHTHVEPLIQLEYSMQCPAVVNRIEQRWCA